MLAVHRQHFYFQPINDSPKVDLNIGANKLKAPPNYKIGDKVPLLCACVTFYFLICIIDNLRWLRDKRMGMAFLNWPNQINALLLSTGKPKKFIA